MLHGNYLITPITNKDQIFREYPLLSDMSLSDNICTHHNASIIDFYPLGYWWCTCSSLKEESAGYFWSCIFVFFIAHWTMWNNINHWHKNAQLELFLTLLSCNYNTTISIKTNRSKTWTLPMMSPALTSWKIDYAETTKLGGWLVFSLGLLMFRLVDS